MMVHCETVLGNVPREPATTHAETDQVAFHIPHPFTIVRYLPTVSSYRLVLLKPPPKATA